MASEPVTREELHHRSIEMRGFRRSDGLYEVEGRVTDRKTYEFRALLGDGVVAAGDPLHDMGVRLVFDDDMLVHQVETFTNASPYAICPAGGDALQSLKGLRMSSGWSARVRERLSASASCTHLVQLLAPMATVAFQTLSIRRREQTVERDKDGRPLKIDSCYAYGAAQSLVRQNWPEFADPPAASPSNQE